MPMTKEQRILSIIAKYDLLDYNRIAYLNYKGILANVEDKIITKYWTDNIKDKTSKALDHTRWPDIFCERCGHCEECNESECGECEACECCEEDE